MCTGESDFTAKLGTTSSLVVALCILRLCPAISTCPELSTRLPLLSWSNGRTTSSPLLNPPFRPEGDVGGDPPSPGHPFAFNPRPTPEPAPLPAPDGPDFQN